eukprot:gene4879-8473_t
MELHMIRQYAKLPKSYAASLMGISISELTQLCKRNGINRWPYHSQKRNEMKGYSPFNEFTLQDPLPYVVAKKKKKRIKNSGDTKDVKGDINFVLLTSSEQELPSFQELMKNIFNQNDETELSKMQ